MTGMMTIGITPETYKKLQAQKHRYEKKENGAVSYNDTINKLIDEITKEPETKEGWEPINKDEKNDKN